MRSLHGLLLAGVACFAAPQAARALELVPGGYGAGLALEERGAAAAPAGDRGAAGVSLDFTPRRGPGGLAGDGDAPGVRFDLTVRGGGDVLDQLGLGTAGPDAPGSIGKGRSSLAVGGAVRWSAWSVGGGVGRADFLGADVDLLSASVGYGRLSAELSVGQSADDQRTRSDVMMLRTDLAARPWLTLESDLALGSSPDAERREDHSVAVGRLGLRLNF